MSRYYFKLRIPHAPSDMCTMRIQQHKLEITPNKPRDLLRVHKVRMTL